MERQYAESARSREARLNSARAKRACLVRRQKGFVALITLCLVLGILLTSHVLHSKASSDSTEKYKYYTWITVESGDTLWSIASTYMDEEYYKNKAAYIDEICNMNHMDREDVLVAGSKLAITYYSEEYMP